MDKETAKSLIASSNPNDRLQAARYLTESARPEDIALLRLALNRESVPWVRVAFRRAIRVASKGDDRSKIISEPPSEVPKDLARAIRADALSSISRLLVHEIAPIVGQLRLFGLKEILHFETSRTKEQVDFLADMLDAIDRLGKAASAPKLESLDLTELIDSAIKSECTNFRGDIKRDGQSHLIAIGDRTLLQLALNNVIRNSVEAISEVFPRGNGGTIVITWGYTDIDNWISVIDNGIGFSGPSEGAFEYGFTKKPSHSGMGLPTAKQAMQSLQGVISLESDAAGGAVCVLRWPKFEITE